MDPKTEQPQTPIGTIEPAGSIATATPVESAQNMGVKSEAQNSSLGDKFKNLFGLSVSAPKQETTPIQPSQQTMPSALPEASPASPISPSSQETTYAQPTETQNPDNHPPVVSEWQPHPTEIVSQTPPTSEMPTVNQTIEPAITTEPTPLQTETPKPETTSSFGSMVDAQNPMETDYTPSVAPTPETPVSTQTLTVEAQTPTEPTMPIIDNPIPVATTETPGTTVPSTSSPTTPESITTPDSPMMSVPSLEPTAPVVEQNLQQPTPTMETPSTTVSLGANENGNQNSGGQTGSGTTVNYG